ncbi:tetratricopeptide repeat protein [Methanococcus maripaludis]|uniref:Tetratricopeptide (TPR) repeat protein n=1 Tax=Methanococcus maripaludis TaxID=39152 RepID=A0A7J9PNJ5_METMI|nr:tetratricopeptide repeat protein [Methanococcus maripaludis]MBA2864378.1 tetratricopeptide (TPR) repeat protein [Methanococcus maripaludis]
MVIGDEHVKNKNYNEALKYYNRALEIDSSYKTVENEKITKIFINGLNWHC